MGNRLNPAARSRVFISNVIAAVVICGQSESTFSQSEIKIAGTVIDATTGSPVPGAAITVLGLSRNTISDVAGSFQFAGLPIGEYDLSAQRIGYANSDIIHVDIDQFTPVNIIIPMISNPVVVEDRVVEADRTRDFDIVSQGNSTIVTLNHAEFRSMRDIVNCLPELELVTSGPRQLLRIRGAQTNGLVVLLDGRIQNSSLTSQGDISAIPMTSVKQIEITRGGKYDVGGLAGAINFITNPLASGSRLSATAQYGSYGFETYVLSLNDKPREGLSIGFDFENSHYRGDFEFADPRDSVQIRLNNHARSIKISGRTEYVIVASRIALKARYFERSAGIPGAVFQSTPYAHARDREKDVYAEVKRRLGNSFQLIALSGLTLRSIDYESPQTPENFISYKSRFDEEARDFKLQVSKGGRQEFDASFSTRYDALDGKDLIRPVSSFGRHARLVSSLAMGANLSLPEITNLVRESTLNVGIRHDNGSGGHFWAPSATCRMIFPLAINIGFDISWYRSRRLPGLTDLYWKEDIFTAPNPELKSEKSTGYEIAADFSGETVDEFSLRVSRFETTYSNLITWRRWGGDKFKPVNLSKALISGWELAFDGRPFDGPITTGWSASSIMALNREKGTVQYNKYLTFRPLVSLSARIEVDFLDLNLKLSGRHIGRRYMTEENTKSLPPVELLDLRLGYEFEFKSLDSQAEIELLNLTDRQYEVLERQPEAPREYRFRLEISHLGGIL